MEHKTFEILTITDSTNNHAMKKVRNGEINGWTSFFALEQTNGKGQRGKTWESQAGENIMMSTVADCRALGLTNKFELSCVTALSCCELLKKYGGDEFSIKWPNDIYWRDRKAGGILIENIIVGDQWEKSIIGTGLNINQTQFGDLPRKAVSLKQITGKTFDPILLAQELSSALIEAISSIKEQKTEAILRKYNDSLYRKGLMTNFKKEQQVFQATVKGVNRNGELVIHHGIDMEIAHGTIEWLD